MNPSLLLLSGMSSASFPGGQAGLLLLALGALLAVFVLWRVFKFLFRVAWLVRLGLAVASLGTLGGLASCRDSAASWWRQTVESSPHYPPSESSAP